MGLPVIAAACVSVGQSDPGSEPRRASCAIINHRDAGTDKSALDPVGDGHSCVGAVLEVFNGHNGDASALSELLLG
jgi:hypothetical protein